MNDDGDRLASNWCTDKLRIHRERTSLRRIASAMRVTRGYAPIGRASANADQVAEGVRNATNPASPPRGSTCDVGSAGSKVGVAARRGCAHDATRRARFKRRRERCVARNPRAARSVVKKSLGDLLRASGYDRGEWIARASMAQAIDAAETSPRVTGLAESRKRRKAPSRPPASDLRFRSARRTRRGRATRPAPRPDCPA